MSKEFYTNRRGFLRTMGLTIAASQLGIFGFANAQSRGANMQTSMNTRRTVNYGSDIVPFTVHMPDETLADLRKRIVAHPKTKILRMD